MRQRQKGTRSVRQPRQFVAKKVTVDGIEFDSQTEAAYYKLLKKDPAVKDIEVQPQFQIIDRYKVACKRCSGTGQQVSIKTGNPVKCSLCKGKGEREKPGAVYTADFRVTFLDGFEEVIEIKGGPVTRDFPLRKKLFEMKSGKELIVVRRKRAEWIRE